MAPKSEKKKQQKIIEDRTFGLKNKNKSKAVQKYVKGVQNTVKNAGKSAGQLEAQQYERAKQKKKEEEQQALLNSLYKDVNKIRQQQSSEQEDPKNVVCPYFKQGLCQKGKKCIYSHDLTLDRKEEIDLYVDQRTQLIMNQIGTKNLNDLSEEELSKMISDKEKDYIKGAKSEIVCKFFLQAVQKGKYGWNWSCANGGDACKYKHCLPPGYILSKDGGNTKIEIEEVNIEEKIDEQRNKLLSENKGSPLVTYEVFLKWKQSKIFKKKEQEQKRKKQQEKKNKNKQALRTGKQLFNIDPTLFIDDQEAADNYDEREQMIEEEEQGKRQQGEQGEQGMKIEEGERQGEEGDEKAEEQTYEEEPANGHENNA